MTYGQYSAQCAAMQTEILAIAEKTGRMAILGTANESNAIFLKLMQRHAALTTKAAALDQKYLSQLSAGMRMPRRAKRK